MKDLLVIDVGGTHIKFVSIRGDAHQELGRHYPTKLLRTGDPIDAFAQIIWDVSKEFGFAPEAVVSTVPGFLNPDLDLVHYAGNVPELNGRRVASELSGKLGVPVYLERDSILLLRGEWAMGAGRHANHLLGLFFGTGVGGAFLQDGKPFRGAGFAMEIGSMPFKGLGRTMDGLRPDCLETYVSGRVLAQIAERHNVPIEQVFTHTDSNDKLRADVDEFVRDMGMAVACAMTLLSPDTTVVGGGICAMKAFPHAALFRAIDEIAPVSETGGKHSLRWAELGWKAAAYGAVLRADEEDMLGPQGRISTQVPNRVDLRG